MMINKYQNIYFIGIGGVGMSALAGWCYDKKINVLGYDRNSNDYTLNLKLKGIKIEHNLDVKIDIDVLNNNNTLVVYTPAIQFTNPIYNFFRKNNYQIIKRSDLLGLICNKYKVIAVSGTHGKTTVSIMLAHILTSAGLSPNAFFGGLSNNYNSNYILGNSKYMIVEADEYDKSFLKLNPFISIITSIDEDHIDTYKSYDDMINAYIDFCEITLQNRDMDLYKTSKFNSNIFISDVASKIMETKIGNSKIIAFNKINTNLQSNKIFSCISQHMPDHNIKNFIVASSIAQILGVEDGQIHQAFKTYLGVKRRFEYHSNTENLILIDDYAHHPEELNVLINSVRTLHPNKEVFLIFQPHLFSRTQHLRQGFIEVLSHVDGLALLDIYPAREQPIPGVNSNSLLSEINLKNKWNINHQKVLKLLCKVKPSLIVLAGAGDVHKLIPQIKSLYL